MAEDTADRIISAAYVLDAEVLEKYRRDFPEMNSLCTLIAGIGLIDFAFFGRNIFDISQTTLVPIGLFFIVLYPLSKWAQKSHIRRFRLHQRQIAYGFIFDENGCRLSKDGAEKMFEWSQIYRVQQTAAYFLLWRKGHKHFRWLPRNAFASDEDIELFLEYLRRAKVKVSKGKTIPSRAGHRYLRRAKVKVSKGSADGSLIFTLFRARPKRVW